MIVLNGNEEPQKQDSYNGLTIRAPERVARRRRSWSPLPDYEASEAQYRRSLALEHKKMWHQTKVWRAVLFLLLAYALLTTVIGVPIIKMKHEDADDSSWSVNAVMGSQQPSPSGVVTLGNNMACNMWNHTNTVNSSLPYQTTLQLELPAMGDISIRSNATLDSTQSSNVTGNLTVDYDANLKSNNAQISVTMWTSTHTLQKTTLVCSADVGPNRGLSIFFPSYMSEMETIFMDIRVVLPKSVPPSSLISNFNVYLPVFAQTFRDLNAVNFNSVTIEGTVLPINVAGIRAPRISVKNMLGDISGTFNVSESLCVDTIKGSINTTITLVKPTSRPTPTTLTIDNGDREINAHVSLVSAYKTSSSPHFVGKVTTFNAPANLTVNYYPSTPPLPVYFSLQNNLARSKVVMDQKFQGTYLAQTKLAPATIHQGIENPKYNPAGSNKPRTLRADPGSSTSRSSGWIGWGKKPPNDEQSHVQVTSSLGPVDLEFGPT
ncbi:hypothetical protein P691DRAFT_657243 [Macrolepiota fuliginosa MF-IS2]|uniref:Uncharacterized protein n=1 Tax=Macrolepiota fuliginosa MF-IS2 TaxID=1400762 RepID=A0A9P6C6H3_9AGAR|nr:hypothetical protein P691DRAFT_657243 [Macrolepiota fuliginosa MF-IS2]